MQTPTGCRCAASHPGLPIVGSGALLGVAAGPTTLAIYDNTSAARSQRVRAERTCRSDLARPGPNCNRATMSATSRCSNLNSADTFTNTAAAAVGHVRSSRSIETRLQHLGVIGGPHSRPDGSHLGGRPHQHHPLRLRGLPQLAVQ